MNHLRQWARWCAVRLASFAGAAVLDRQDARAIITHASNLAGYLGTSGALNDGRADPIARRFHKRTRRGAAALTLAADALRQAVR